MSYEVVEHNAEELEEALSSFAGYVDDLVLVGDAPDEPYYVVVIGSTAFLLEDASGRDTTEDIDVHNLYLPPAARDVMYDCFMDTRSMAYIYTLPYNYEDRLVPMLETQNLTVYRPSWEDLVYAKLQRDGHDDILDITVAANQELIDWDLLHHIMTDPDEALGSGMPRHRYHELLTSYNSFLHQMGQPTMDTIEILDLLANAE